MRVIDFIMRCSYPLWVNFSGHDVCAKYVSYEDAVRHLMHRFDSPVLYVTTDGEGELTIEI